MPELRYKEITEKIIGASFEVHKFLGNGFQEVIYQRALPGSWGKPDYLMQGKLSRKFIIKNCRNRLEQEEQTLL